MQKMPKVWIKLLAIYFMKVNSAKQIVLKSWKLFSSCSEQTVKLKYKPVQYSAIISTNDYVDFHQIVKLMKYL